MKTLIFFVAAQALITLNVFAQNEPKYHMERRLIMEQNEPEPFYTDSHTVVAYRAIGAFTAYIVVFDSAGKKVYTSPNLSAEEGAVKIQGSNLSPGKYQFALIVNGRRCFVKTLTVLAAQQQ